MSSSSGKIGSLNIFESGSIRWGRPYILAYRTILQRGIYSTLRLSRYIVPVAWMIPFDSRNLWLRTDNITLPFLTSQPVGPRLFLPTQKIITKLIVQRVLFIVCGAVTAICFLYLVSAVLPTLRTVLVLLVLLENNSVSPASLLHKERRHSVSLLILLAFVKECTIFLRLICAQLLLPRKMMLFIQRDF